MDEKVYVVGGLEFKDAQQASIAKKELKRIEILDSKLDYENLNSVAMVYEKARANQIFQTPIGISYMLRLQQYLGSNNFDQSELKPVSVPMPQTAQQQVEEAVDELQIKAASSAEAKKIAAIMNGEEDGYKRPASEEVWKSRVEAAKEREKKLQGRIRMSVAGNVILILLVIVMFAISLTSNHPNILNYKSKLITRYSQWEQELKDREAVIREKEASLGIEPIVEHSEEEAQE